VGLTEIFPVYFRKVVFLNLFIYSEDNNGIHQATVTPLHSFDSTIDNAETCS